MRNILLIMALFVLTLSSCSPLKKAQRKARKADMLLKEAAILAPEIMDTLWVMSRDTVTITNDSLIYSNSIVLDTAKVDSLIRELVILKTKDGAKGDPEGTRKTHSIIYKKIYEEILPDTTFVSIDSLRMIIDGKDVFVRFKADITLSKGRLSTSIKALDDINYVSKKAVVEIDARRKSFFQDWKFWLIGIIVGLFLIFRSTIRIWIRGR